MPGAVPSNQNLIAVITGMLILMALAGVFMFMFFSRHEQATKISTNEPVIEISCIDSTDCQLPGEYAVQSSCPYQAYCYDYKCVVGCPMWWRQGTNVNYGVDCQADSECDCSIWDTKNQYQCACLDEQCAAIVAEIY